MEKQLVSILSLEEMALRKVAVLLWNTPLNLFRVCNFQLRSSTPCDHQRDWRETVSYDVSKLQLPEQSIKKKILRIIKPIGLQIVRWKLYHDAYLNTRESSLDVPVLEKLQWTAAGAVDYQKTAEQLVRCDVLDVVQRYKLACLYCLEHYIPELWKELPYESKTNFSRRRIRSTRDPFLHYCWPHILQGEEQKLETVSGDSIPFNQFAFQRLSSEGNKAAAEYFLQKLTRRERGASLTNAALSALVSRMSHMNTYPSSFPNKNIADVVFYLLSQMTPEQKAGIFSSMPANILGCFLDWPLHDAYFDYSDEMWTWMQDEDLKCRASNYNSLLDKMRECIQNSDYYLPDLYQSFFTSCPGDFKKHFVKRECKLHSRSFFPELFGTEDTETIKVILSNLDAEDRLKIASSNPILNLFCDSIPRGRGHLVEMFLKEVGLSKEDKLRLKEVLKTRDNGAIESGTPEWKRMFEFLESSN